VILYIGTGDGSGLLLRDPSLSPPAPCPVLTFER